MVERIISGGQTGVDRAALDVALELGLPCGGWCPRGRRADDGAIDPRYPLEETPSQEYEQRTEWNVRDSDATLVLLQGVLAGGTARTIQLATEQLKPCLVINLDRPMGPHDVRAWIRQQRVRVLNLAGPRESQRPGIYEHARDFLRAVLA